MRGAKTGVAAVLAAGALMLCIGGVSGQAAAAPRSGAALPRYDVMSSCSLSQRGMKLCLSANASDQAFLQQVWAGIPAAVRQDCVSRTDANDPRAYGELARCVYPLAGWTYSRDQGFGRHVQPGPTTVTRSGSTVTVRR